VKILAGLLTGHNRTTLDYRNALSLMTCRRDLKTVVLFRSSSIFIRRS